MPERAQSTVTTRLRRAGCVDADGEAVAFLAAAPDTVTLEAWIRRREQGEPVAWIVGSVAFGEHRLRITPGVYVPRPHTEELARRAATRLPGDGRAVDLCTGCGAVARHLIGSAPAARVVGVDLDPAAARCSRSNSVPSVAGDLAGPITGDGTWDLVTAVAPYVPTGAVRLLPPDVQRHEPRRALDGGDDGLDLVRRIVDAAARLLRPGGWLVVELGGDQDAVIAPALADRGFDALDAWRDEDGDLRGIEARRR